MLIYLFNHCLFWSGMTLPEEEMVRFRWQSSLSICVQGKSEGCEQILVRGGVAW